MTGAPADAGSLKDAIAAIDAGLEAPAVSQAVPMAPAAAAPASRYVLFSIATTHYAVAEACVTELDRVPSVTMVPRVPAWLCGVTNLRGDIVSVVDLRTFVGLAPYAPATARLLVTRLIDEPFTTGLIVDAVDRIVTLHTADIAEPASPLDGPLAPYLTGVCTVGERLVAVLDIDRLLRSAEIRQFDEPGNLDTGALRAPAETH